MGDKGGCVIGMVWDRMKLKDGDRDGLERMGMKDRALE